MMIGLLVKADQLSLFVRPHVRHDEHGLVVVHGHTRKRPIYFSSGANHPGELLGHEDVGHAVGVSAGQLNARALDVLDRMTVPTFVPQPLEAGRRDPRTAGTRRAGRPRRRNDARGRFRPRRQPMVDDARGHPPRSPARRAPLRRSSTTLIFSVHRRPAVAIYRGRRRRAPLKQARIGHGHAPTSDLPVAA